MADDEQPSNPFESSSIPPENGHTVIDAAEGSLSQGAPKVAAKAGKAYVAFGLLGIIVVAIFYNILGGSKSEEAAPTEPTKIVIESKEKEPPPLPTPVEEKKQQPENPPEQAEVKPPLPPIQPPSIPEPASVPLPDSINPIKPKEDSAEKAQALARLKSGLMLKDGGAAAAGGTDTSALHNAASAATSSSSQSTDQNSQFAAAAGSSKVERVDATKITALRRTIAQGRIIQATLESAINTDLPAPIRAIVSVDTYGEAGDVPLIPKGSRLIGVYNTTLTSGQTRVFVVWQRVIRPDGVDVQLGSPLVDAIGQAGVAGQLDTKFQEIFARSLVSSVMNIAMAIGTDKISGGSTTTTTSTTGSQTTGDTVTAATTNALNRLGAMTDSFIQRFISVPPTILVDQGTKVNVMVNKDVYFPEDTTGVRILN